MQTYASAVRTMLEPAIPPPPCAPDATAAFAFDSAWVWRHYASHDAHLNMFVQQAVWLSEQLYARRHAGLERWAQHLDYDRHFRRLLRRLFARDNLDAVEKSPDPDVINGGRVESRRGESRWRRRAG